MHFKAVMAGANSCLRALTTITYVSLSSSIVFLASITSFAFEIAALDQQPDHAGHWSFDPIHRQAPPSVQNLQWPRNVVDRFVLEKLDKEGLTPSPQADPITLVRRLFFD